MSNNEGKSTGPELLISTKDFFREVVVDAFEKRKVSVFPLVFDYIVDLLERHVAVDHLYNRAEESGRKSRETLAEMYLKAQSGDPNQRIGRLKRLGDTSLYVSGFFGDSLRRQLVDVDYYVEMGGLAFRQLSYSASQDLLGKLYSEFSNRFMEFVDILTYISEQTRMQSDTDLLRLYDKYVSTGSELAKDQLVEKGFMVFPDQKKHSQ